MKTLIPSRRSGVLEAYLRDVGRIGVLDAAQERLLARAYQAGDLRALQRLVAANLRFVVRIANEYRRTGLPASDLIQEGNIGLLLAAKRFDPDRGNRLVTYAGWWVRARIHAHVVRCSSIVRTAQVHAGDAPLPPSRDVRLDAPPRSGDAGHLDEVERAASEAHAAGDPGDAFLRGRVVEALGILDRRELFVVKARILCDEPLTLGEVGERLGFSRERARQIEERARKKLRERLAETVAADRDGAGARHPSGAAGGTFQATSPGPITRSA